MPDQGYDCFQVTLLLVFVKWIIWTRRLSQNAKVLKCYAPDAFSGAKFQVFLENGHEIDVG